MSSGLKMSAALEFINSYAWTAVRRDEVKRGPFRSCGQEDVVQQIHLELCNKKSGGLGPDYARHVGNALSCGYVLRAFVKAIWRATSKARYTHKHSPGLPLVVSVPNEDALPVDPCEAHSVDLDIDLNDAVARFSRLEKQVWGGVREGKSTREIGHEMSMDFRRVAEIRKRVLEQVAVVLGEKPREE
jgi:hypothetical protein